MDWAKSKDRIRKIKSIVQPFFWSVLPILITLIYFIIGQYFWIKVTLLIGTVFILIVNRSSRKVLSIYFENSTHYYWKALIGITIPVLTILFLIEWFDDNYIIGDFQLPPDFEEEGITPAIAKGRYLDWYNYILNQSEQVSQNNILIKNPNIHNQRLTVSDVSFDATMVQLVNVTKTFFGRPTRIIEFSITRNNNYHNLEVKLPDGRIIDPSIETGGLSKSQILTLLAEQAAIKTVEFRDPIAAAFFYNNMGNFNDAKRMLLAYPDNLPKRDKLVVFIQLGIAFWMEGNFITADYWFKAARSLDTDDERALYFLANTSYKIGSQNPQELLKLKEALSYIDSLPSDHYQGQLLKVKTELKLGDSIRARETTKSLLEKKPYLPIWLEALNFQSEFYAADKNYSKADSCLNQVISNTDFGFGFLYPTKYSFWKSADPNNKFKLYLKGMTQQKPDSIINYMRKVLNQDSLFIYAIVSIADSYMKKGEYYTALSYLTKAKKIQPFSNTIQYELLRCFTNMGDFQSAKEIIEIALTQNPLNLNLIKQYLVVSNNAKIPSNDYYLHYAGAINPHSIEYHHAKILKEVLPFTAFIKVPSVTHLNQDSLSKIISRGISEVNKALIINPNDTFAIYMGSLLHMGSGMTTKSNELLTRLIKISPRYKSAYFLRAANYLQMGDYKSFLKDVRKSISLSATSFDYLLLGSYYYDEGYPEEVITNYEKALKLSGTQEESTSEFNNLVQSKLESIYYSLADCYSELDMYDQSSKYFRKAMQQSPFNCDYLMEWEQVIRKGSLIKDVKKWNAAVYRARCPYIQPMVDR